MIVAQKIKGKNYSNKRDANEYYTENIKEENITNDQH
jgi:hypothetical protein